MQKLRSGDLAESSQNESKQENDNVLPSKPLINAKRIHENFPFYGTLMRKEGTYYRRKQEIESSQPITIEDVEDQYGPGQYQVRLYEGESEHTVDFTIQDHSDPEPESNKKSVPASESHEFYRSVKQEAKEEARQEFAQNLKLLEKQINSYKSELEEKSRKIRELNEEIAEIERKQYKELRSESDRTQERIDELKERIDDLKFENFELQQELKYADLDEPFDIKKMLQDALKNPQVMQMLAPILNKVMGEQPAPAPQQIPGQLSGASPHQAESSHPDQRPNPQAEQPDAALSDTPDQPEQPKQNTLDPMELAQQAMSKILETAQEAIISSNPDLAGVKAVVDDQIAKLNERELTPHPEFWINIARGLIQFAQQNDIGPTKVAEVIEPVLNQFGQAKTALKYSPVDAAVNTLFGMFNIQADAAEKQFLKEVLKYFKQKLKAEPA
ncbi:MAG: hypothetical protein ACQETE_01640 [Bacteroidota bacterium]